MTQYVPVLRTKLAEWMALRPLPEDVRRAVTPTTWLAAGMNHYMTLTARQVRGAIR